MATRGIQVLCAGLMFVLAGCATRQMAPLPGNLADADNWAFAGKLGVRAEGENANLHIEWVQQGEAFEIDLAGPLGLSVARIHGDENEAILETAEGKRVKARNPDELLAGSLGYDIPVAPMKYWVRGLPAPWAPYRRTARGVRQLGWTIAWREWQRGRPVKMTFEFPGASLKLVVRQWSSGI